jgi:hypothetical protein
MELVCNDVKFIIWFSAAVNSGVELWDGVGWDGMGWDGMGWDGMPGCCFTHRH